MKKTCFLCVYSTFNTIFEPLRIISDILIINSFTIRKNIENNKYSYFFSQKNIENSKYIYIQISIFEILHFIAKKNTNYFYKTLTFIYNEKNKNKNGYTHIIPFDSLNNLLQQYLKIKSEKINVDIFIDTIFIISNSINGIYISVEDIFSNLFYFFHIKESIWHKIKEHIKNFKNINNIFVQNLNVYFFDVYLHENNHMEEKKASLNLVLKLIHCKIEKFSLFLAKIFKGVIFYDEYIHIIENDIKISLMEVFKKELKNKNSIIYKSDQGVLNTFTQIYIYLI